MRKMLIKITEENANFTIRQMAKKLNFSTRLLTRLKATEDGITVNGEHKTVRYILKSGDLLEFRIEDEKSSEGIRPYSAPVTLLWEDEWYAAFAKPASLPTHPARRHQGDTLASRIAARYKDENFIFRALTRLDLDTSGVVIIAKNQLAANEFSKLLISRKVEKEYTAVCLGKIESDKGVISYRIRRRDERSIMREALTDSSLDGEEAKTEYKVIKRCDNATLVSVFPVTGRTHQIRVHMNAIGHPVLCDTLYSVPSEFIGRQALHATKITFVHPFTKKTISVSCPLFDDMRECIASLFGEIQ